MRSGARIWIAGSVKPLGRALRRVLDDAGGYTIADDDPDYTDTKALAGFMKAFRPEYVFVAAGKSGGIQYNIEYGADLMQDNLRAATNILAASHAAGVEKLLYLASSCVYPREADQPLREEALLTGPLEPTNAPYAMSNLAGMALCRAYHEQHGASFIAAIPTNHYGPDDSFGEDAHVIGALLRRMHDAKQAGAGTVTVWGSGNPVREFLYADDIARAAVRVMEQDHASEPINLGSGDGVTIAELAERIREVVRFEGNLVFDNSKPDGMPKKVLDGARLAALGWTPVVTLDEGLRRTYDAMQTASRVGAA